MMSKSRTRPALERKSWLSVALLSVVFCVDAGFGHVQGQELKSRGVVQSQMESTLSAELVAKIVKIPVLEGMPFRKGDLLLAFECNRYEAQHAAALAEVAVEQASLVEAQTLKKFRAGGSTAVEIADAKVKRARAQADVLKSTLNQCEIRAPYSGRVVKWLVNNYEIPSANQPLLKIVNDKKIEAELLVPSKWLRWLQRGQEFRFGVDETGQIYTMKVSQIAALVDAVSQRVRIQADFVSSPDRVLPGMSGVALFALPVGQ